MIMSRPASWRRQFALLLILVMAALARIEQGLGEVQGRADAPTRLLRLAPAADGCWDAAFLGYSGHLCTRVVRSPHWLLAVPSRVAYAGRALPGWLGSSLVRLWEILLRPDRHPLGGSFLVFHNEQVDSHIQHLRLNAGSGGLLHQVDVSTNRFRWH